MIQRQEIDLILGASTVLLGLKPPRWLIKDKFFFHAGAYLASTQPPENPIKQLLKYTIHKFITKKLKVKIGVKNGEKEN